MRARRAATSRSRVLTANGAATAVVDRTGHRRLESEATPPRQNSTVRSASVPSHGTPARERTPPTGNRRPVRDDTHSGGDDDGEAFHVVWKLNLMVEKFNWLWLVAQHKNKSSWSWSVGKVVRRSSNTLYSTFRMSNRTPYPCNMVGLPISSSSSSSSS